MRTTLFLALFTVLLAYTVTESAAQDRIYWTEPTSGKVKMMSLEDSSEAVTILAENFVEHHASDFDRGVLYWIDRGKSSIIKSNLDGSNQVVIVENLISPGGIAIDEHDALYYADDGKIFKADSLGQNRFIFHDNLSSPGALHYCDSAIYWSDDVDNTINKIQLNGLSESEITADASNVVSIVVHEITKDLFWSQDAVGPIFSGLWKIDTNGVVANLEYNIPVGGLFIDSELNHLYWSRRLFSRVNKLDLSTKENTIVTDKNSDASSLSLDKDSGVLYFSTARLGVYMARVDLANADTVLTIAKTIVQNPYALQIDTDRKKLYWTNANFGTTNHQGAIMRSNLDGDSIEVVVSHPEIEQPGDIYLDSINSFLYWSDSRKGSISRMNLSNGNIEPILSDLYHPNYLIVDGINQRIYWTGFSSEKIFSYDINTTVFDTIFTGMYTTPGDLGIDYLNSKIIWAGRTDDVINRSDFDGMNQEEIILSDSFMCSRINSLFVDNQRNRMFFLSPCQHKELGFSNLDGSQIQFLDVQGVTNPANCFILNDHMSDASAIQKDQQREVTVFPNPFKSDLNFDSEDEISAVTIFNNLGQVVYRNIEIINHQSRINLSDLKTGVYFALFKIGKGYDMIKLLKVE